MKKHLFLKTLLVLVGVLVTSLTIPAKAWFTISSTEDIYFDATDQYTNWNLSTNGLYVKIYYGGGSSTSVKQMTRIDGTYLYYCDQFHGHDNVSGIEFMAGVDTDNLNLGTGQCSFSGWGSALGSLKEMCYHTAETTNWSWGTRHTTNPPLNTISLDKYNTTTYGGNGTSANPYLVAAGSTVQVEVTSTKRSSNLTAEYKFTVDESTDANYTTTTTKQVVASAVDGTTYTVSVEGWGQSGSEYSYRGITSNTVYFQGIEAYQLTYSIGSVAGNDGDISTDPTTASGTHILSGNTVTLTAPAAKDGYTWSGWYTNAAGTEGKIDDTKRAITVTMNADKELYACYTENKSAITINAPETYEGSLSTTGEQSLGVATTLSLTATAANGYKFHEWASTGNAVLSTTNGNPTTVSADGTDGGSGTVSAVFVSRFAVIGSDIDDNYGAAVNGMPGWDDYSKTLDYVAANDFERTFTLKGNTTYKFRLRDFSTDKNLGYEYAGSITLNGGDCWLNNYNSDVTFTLDGSDEVTFKIIGFGGAHVNLQVNTSDGLTTSYTASYYSQTFYKNSTNETSTTGGTVSAKDGKEFDLATGGKVKAGGLVVFTAVPNANYTFAGWFSDAACTAAYVAGEDVAIDDVYKTLTLSNIAADKTVYAKFRENTTPTAVDNTAVSKKAVKRIVNGQLVIEREGKLYNALGAEVK